MRDRSYFVLISTIIIIGLVIQLQVQFNHDIGWVLHVAGRLLNGAEFGTDIVAPNPPLIFYLSVPIVYIADTFDLPLFTVFRYCCILFGVSSLTLCNSILDKTSLGQQKPYLQNIVFIIAIFIFPLAWRDFGQREYLSLLSIYPFAFLTFARLDGQEPKKVTCFILGIIAGIGISLKPHMMLIPLGLLIYALFYVRLKILRWVEYYGMAIMVACYILCVWLFCSSYLTEVIPLVLKLYWGFNTTMQQIVTAYWQLFIFVALWWLMIWINNVRPSKIQMILFITYIGFVFNLLAQEKGYTYHAYPATVSVALLLASSMFTPLSQLQSKVIRPQFSKVTFTFLFFVFFLVQAYYPIIWTMGSINPNGFHHKRNREIVEEIERLAPGAPYTAFSTHPFPGFPIALMVNAKWVGDTNSHMAIPAIVKSMEQGIPIDPSVEEFARSQVLTTIKEYKPQVVLVDQREGRHAIISSNLDFIDYYSQDPEFRKVWSIYEKVSSINGIDFYRASPAYNANNEY